MNIIIVDERTNKTKTVAFNGKTVKDVLQTLKINQETVLVVRNNEVLTSNENLNDKDKIELLSVISGG
ncbi:TPA: MoaD/ThiS family protein [Candidatus Woesearchaeota archaeon]|nr:MoaD/ThiS family protein [Candidatus Woesearchaeota archaeon]